MTAVGDTVSIREEVTTTEQYLDIRPDSGAEWMIYTIDTGGAWELYKCNSGGTLPSKVDSGSGPDLLHPLKLTVTNSIYYRIKNISGADNPFGFEGVVKK